MTLTTVKQVWSFLGFGNYYRKFIKDYGNLMKPLNKLLKKDKKFEWTDEAQQAFDTLKGKFQAAPVLQLPDPYKPLMVECDALKYASGAVLQQQDSNGDWHLLGDLMAALEIRRVERSTAVEPLKIRDAVVKPLVSRVG